MFTSFPQPDHLLESKQVKMRLISTLFVIIVQISFFSLTSGNISMDLPSALSSSSLLEEQTLASSGDKNKECNKGSCVELVCAESEISLEQHSARYSWKVNGLQNFISSMKDHHTELNMTTAAKFNSLPSHDGEWMFGFTIRMDGELEVRLSCTPTYNASKELEDDFTYNVKVTVVSPESHLFTFPSRITQGDNPHLLLFVWVDQVDRFVFPSLPSDKSDVTELQFVINAYRVNRTVVASNVDCQNNKIFEDVDEHEPNLILDLEPLPQIGNLMKNDRYADLVIKSGDEEFKVHRAILANSSPVFATMIFNKTFDKNESLLDLGEKVDSDTLEEIIRYIYTGKIEDIDEIADSLIIAAHTYGFPKLKRLCESALLKQVGTANAFAMYSLAIEVEADRLRQKSFKVMKENKSKIVNQSEEFRKLSVHHPEIMYELCLSN